MARTLRPHNVMILGSAMVLISFSANPPLRMAI
jgi:hypothetical protein